MNKFEITTTRVFMCLFILLGAFAFICVLCYAAWWHIFSGIVCIIIYRVLKYDLKKEKEAL